MTVGQLKEKVMALLKTGMPSSAVTLPDRLMREYVTGYNKALADVLVLIESMKKETNK